MAKRRPRFPSQETIASMTRLSRRTVQRALDALIGDGLILVQSERRTGHFARNHYDLSPLWHRLAVGGPRPLLEALGVVTTPGHASS